MIDKRDYTCVKCGGSKYETRTIRTTGSGFSRFFDIQRYRWAAITCTRCAYTELYSLAAGKSAVDVLDFFTS